MKEKVLFVITKSNFGGAQRYVYELATRLQTDGYDTAVALGGNGILKTKLESAGVVVFPISAAQRDISITKEIRVLWRLYRIIRKYKPNVVHLNSPKIGGLGAVAARVASLFNSHLGFTRDRRVNKIIYTNHGWPFNEPRPEWQLVIIRFFSWLTVFLGGTTIVLSQTEKDDVRMWPFIQKKLVIVPNGVSTFPLKNHEEALTHLIGKEKADLWISEKRNIVGTISELHRNKGLLHALEGIEMYTEQYPHKPIGYIVIGEGEQRKDLEEFIIEKKLTNCVVLAGHVDEAREYLKAFDIFLLSSVKEGLPFAILEAGYAGVPVISTSVGGIPEVISNLENGMLIPPRRPQEIEHALAYLDDQPEAKAQMTKAFKKRIDEKYNFELIVADIKRLYKKENEEGGKATETEA